MRDSGYNWMSETERATVNSMRHRGFAVVVFNPEEVGSANPRRIEDRLVEFAQTGVIEDLQY